MLRKLRYAAAILCGSAIFTAAALSACNRPANDTTDDPGVRSETESEGGDIGKRESEPGDDDEDPAPESREEETEVTASEDSTEETEGTEEPTEESEDPESLTGLRKYFQNKLIVNTEKASLYLNVREEPDDDSKILSVLYPNDIASYVGKDGNWYAVEREGYTGYVNASYVYTDREAYEHMVDCVAYAAMVQNYESYLYAVPDATTEIILCAHKSDAFRLKGISGGFYEVEVSSELYDTLFMPMDDAIIYYLFLGQGNDNELSDHDEAFFGTLEVEQNLTRSEELIEEYAQDLQEYMDYLASSEAESYAAEQAYIAASRAAQQQAAEAARQSVSSVAAEAKNSGDAQYLGRFLITHYCHCQICCGVWGSNDPNYQAYGESGIRLQSDYTVAVNSGQIPFGTRLLINGKEYITADTGALPNSIDIYRQHHADALAGGAYYADVYVLP